MAVSRPAALEAKAAPAESKRTRPEEWSLTPAVTAEGDAPSTLAMGLAPAGTVNGSDAEQAKAGAQFRQFIDPVINPERYSELYGRLQSKGAVLKHIAKEQGKSPRTVQRMLQHWGQAGIAGLTRKIRADKGASRALNTAAREFIFAAVLPKHASYGELSTKDVYRLYEEERRWRADHVGKPLTPAERKEYARYIDAAGCLLASAQLSEASYATFCRQVEKVPEVVKTMARKGDDAYRNSELITYRDIAAVAPLDYVVMDHRVLDIFCLMRSREGWTLARPWITCAIDMRTRKWLGWCFVETPSSDSIATVLKQVFVRYGLPKALYWDNGKDFRCHWLEGGKEQSRPAGAVDGLPKQWTGVLETLGVRVHHAIVKNARAKLIEPNFGNIANFDRTLPEWCGHKPGARPERFEKLLQEHAAWMAKDRPETPFRTIEEVATLYSEFIEDLNERPHTGDGMHKVTPTGMGWMCPNEAWEILIGRVQRRTIPDDVLQLCFAKRRELTIRNGAVCATFGGQPYHYRLIGNRTSLLALNDRKVELAYDPLDLGSAAVYYENRFIGLAHCLVLRRMGEEAFVQDEKDRRAARREIKRFINGVHQAVPIPDAETHLARRRAVTPARPDVERVEVPLELPAPIAEERAARAEEAAFSFDAAHVSVPVIERPAADDDSTFQFFKGD